jgi:hypothetical protein
MRSWSCPRNVEAEVQRLVAAEALEVLHPHYRLGPRVYYKNLYRYASCFIGGSIATKTEGVSDCVAGARITLRRGATPIDETTSDIFGDFKFDGLDENSGRYLLEIEHSDHETKIIEVPLGKSVNTGTIWL